MLWTPVENRELLQAAGYRWDPDRDAWVKDKTGRELDGRISRSLLPEQLKAWLKAGEGCPRF